ncbi:MAG: ATPase domain-containing protein, partial [Candidatus Kapaibacteriota bacterium]
MKTRTLYRCTSCGQSSPKWMGRCPACGEWETFVEEVQERGTPSRTVSAAGIQAVALPDVNADQAPRKRTGINELDRVLGGGLVPGSIVLLGGDPGMGKSTLTLQL